MGVKNLWMLLSAASKKVDIRQLEGQRIAIDVSIWVIRLLYGFIKAKSEELENAFLQGMYKRIVRVLRYKIKPVFVFDGKPPELKRMTLALRREIREKRVQNLKKMAEKYIVRQLENQIKECDKPTKSSKLAEVDEMTQLEIDQLMLDLDEDELDEFEKQVQVNQNRILDKEFELILEQNGATLSQLGISADDYHGSNINKKLSMINYIKQQVKNQQAEELSQTQGLEQVSKSQIEAYVKRISNKIELDRVREQGWKEIQQLHEKQLDRHTQQTDAMKNLLNDKNV